MEPVVAPRTFSGRYELTHLIARGGMAQVYRALDTRLGRHVALKVLFPELSVDQTFVERFRREAQAAANLSHPNIVAVYDWGEDEGSYFIAMELIMPSSLATELRAEKTLPATRAASIAAEVAAALAYAHRHGVVHRDIKPGNVLLTDEGQVKVTDFGIAQAVSTEEGLTMAGSVMGTAAYFSPEQAEGAVVDGRSDLYSLGVVLFEMLAGRTPFVGDSPVAVASMHVRNPPPMLRDLSPAVPEALERVTMRALAKSPDDRYQTAEEMRADLLRFAQGQPVLATAATAAAVGATSVLGAAAATSTLPARDTTMAVPAQAAAVALEPEVPSALAGSTGGPGDGDEVMPRPSSARSAWLIAGLLVALVVVGLLAWHGLSGASSITVPNVAGQKSSTATATLTDEGLKVTPQLQPSSDPHRPQGIVIGTHPAAGATLKPGDSITLVVSSGPPVQEMVPYVVGLSYQDAVADLEAAKLKYTPMTVQSWNKPVLPGTVLAQNVASGILVPSGTTVTLKLLASGGSFAMPNVTNTSAIAAAQTLGSYGLSVGTTSNACSSTAKGLVAGTNPGQGTLVVASTTVNLTVSTGPCPVPVPDVIGETVAQATSTLTAQQFNPVANTTCPVGEISTGFVASQVPTATQKAAPGSTVSFQVGCNPSGNSQNTPLEVAHAARLGGPGIPRGHRRARPHAHRAG